MNIDKIRLKKLAEAATPGPWCWDKGEDPRPHTYGIATDADPERMVVNQDFGIELKEDAYFIAAASPTTVLALLAEIDELAFEPAKHSRRLIDQLKAENEALRKQVADLSPFKNAPPQGYRASNKCLACGEYHHGLGNLPCPRCTPVAQLAIAKEASHG